MTKTLFNARIANYIAELEADFAQISAERKGELEKIADFVRKQAQAGEPADLIFICTHNSRRSHMAQLWAEVAKYYYEIPHIRSFSGGTEVTAFNPRSVAALQRAGFDIEMKTKGQNPHYEVRFAAHSQAIVCFSKKFSDATNPQKDFCAVMTCTSADEGCPFVAGASARVPIPYEDPKAFDNTDRETQMYDERVRQIAVEMFYAISKVKNEK
ncbi:MAG: protein-tyrosine-phosphatase [Bernardetiaceae bacterium]|nr:protein-tyrosine-phosphatase [Bernardetiaceae bacterium]